MKFYCSLCDKNYLKNFCLMFESLTINSSDKFSFFHLCLDDETFNYLETKYTNLKLYKISDLNNFYKFLHEYKQSTPYNEFCWSLASLFCKFVLNTEIIDHIMYIDSDIYFYKDPEIIFTEQSNKSIGLIRHRHNTNLSPDGEYNVGIVYFKNDEVGKSCLDWWSNAIVYKTNQEFSSCGDQKYLENFENLYPNDVKILDETFAHGAPWNFRLYVYDYYFLDGSVIWGNKKQPLIFNHFSRLKIENGEIIPTSGQYADHTLNFQIFNIPAVKNMYLDYGKKLMEIKL